MALFKIDLVTEDWTPEAQRKNLSYFYQQIKHYAQQCLKTKIL